MVMGRFLALFAGNLIVPLVNKSCVVAVLAENVGAPVLHGSCLTLASVYSQGITALRQFDDDRFDFLAGHRSDTNGCG